MIQNRKQEYNPLKASIYDDTDKLIALPSKLAIEARKKKKFIMKEYIKKNKKKIVLISVILFPITIPLFILGTVGFFIGFAFYQLYGNYLDAIDEW